MVGPAGPGGGDLVSDEDLVGLACRTGDALAGVLEVSYDDGGYLRLRCAPTAQETLTVAVTGSGTVRSTPAGIDCGTTCSADFQRASQVQLSAVAATGQMFVGWGGACSGSGACTVTMSAAKTVTATFAQQVVIRVLVANEGSTAFLYGANSVEIPFFNGDCTQTGRGTRPCTVVVPAAPITLEAVPGAGDTFAGWSGACTGPQRQCTFTPAPTGVPGSPQTVTASFNP